MINENWEIYPLIKKRIAPETDEIKLAAAQVNASNAQNVNRNWVDEFQLNDTSLTQHHIAELWELFDEFKDVCSEGDHDLGRTTFVEHEINMGNAQPIKQPLRRINPAQRPIVDKKSMKCYSKVLLFHQPPLGAHQ